jgi:hypothetical protein
MKFERIISLVIIVALITLLIHINDLKSRLEHSFLAGSDQKILVEKSKALLIKEQGIPSDEIDTYFYTSYAFFSNETCIRFVPKPRVLGGATSYCYSVRAPVRLERTDKSS